MKKWISGALAIITCLLLSTQTLAGQFKTIKNIEVHYSAFNSAFLTPDIARQYKIQRNGYNALLNISVLDNSQAGKPAIEANISGKSKNLLGQMRTLEFRKITEGKAIYYIAQLPISDEETLTFDLDIDAGLTGKGKVRFNQKFYVEQ
ncbi:DUF4426 domain-containing protein [Vibrio sp. SCSIO 43136]|uniref:DUF4426 domain-containing protein n=1 Tax=Vibrio sp. SCSIO 43136 TaxID=2819101 RepID=UPI002074F7A7|nr:DUF4426 domain-containing protein [Vibrio sp. SCSIO 43136]USD65611.1 DUF4426 domain-containing protein [Vibrio sp. SCSIO 43136]